MFTDLIEELTTLSATELDAVIAEAELAKRATETRLAAAVAVVSARGSFRNSGHRSIRTYLTGTLNCSGAHANKIRRRADLINNHGTVGDAFLAGRVGVDRLATAATHPSIHPPTHPRAGDQFGDFVRLLLEQAEQLEYNDFDNVINHFIDRADPDGAFDNQQFQQDQRTASVRNNNGAITVHACGTTPDPLVNILFDHVPAGNALFKHGLTDTPNIFGLPDDVFAAAADLSKHRCQTSTGTSVHPDVALRALIVGRVQRVVVDADNVVINLGRTQRPD